MFEDQIVGPQPAQVNDPNGRFAVVREACRSVIQRLPPNNQPTLVLLDAKDVDNGILEVLLGCHIEVNTDKVHELARKITNLAQKPPFLLAICISQPSLQAWDTAQDNDFRSIKEREFFIRLFESYKLAFVLTNLRAEPTLNDLEQITSRLERHLSGALFESWADRFETLKRDIHIIATKVLTSLNANIVKRYFDGSSSDERDLRFLQIMSRLDQFGKRSFEHILSGTRIDSKKNGLGILENYGHGSYGLRQRLNAALKLGPDGNSNVLELFSHLQAYRLFRDSARWLGDGAFQWARSYRPRSPSGRFLALFIDENLTDPATGDILCASITEIFLLLFGEDGFEVNVIDAADGALPTHEEDKNMGTSILAIDSFFETDLPKRILKVERLRLEHGRGSREWQFPHLGAKKTLHEYDVIFCEVDYGRRFAGPQVVQKLSSYLERRLALELERTSESNLKKTDGDQASLGLPALIVLTHMDNFGHVQQCLNLGAHAFVNRQRMYQIPSRLKRALEDVNPVSTDGPDRPLMRRERFGQHSNFRSLYSLRPDRAEHLRNDTDANLRVVGGWGGQGASGGQQEILWDAQDRDWIRSLPKADLHCHFGTSITLRTIEALAYNTCGHLLANWTKKPQAGVRVLIKDVCAIIKRAVSNMSEDQRAGKKKPAAEYYFRAMEKTIFGCECAQRVPNDPYGEIVKALMKKNPPIKEYSAVSLLVGITAYLRHNGKTDDLLNPWNYFEGLSKWCGDRDKRHREKSWPDHDWRRTSVVRAARLAVQGLDAIVRSIGPASLPELDIPTEWRALRRQNVTLTECGELWESWRSSITERAQAADDQIEHFLGPTCGLKAPSLEELVSLPDNPDDEDYSLVRYLWGCGLLGAEHLQYPENIVLAAHDLVRQNVKDRVVYTEVRCETPGYTKAGMNPVTVTDLLCAAFDMAAVFERDFHGGPLIRTNVLLGAKRHKSREDREKVVSLLAGYLTRRRVFPPDLYQGLPGWWKPAQVVGFDLSGKEDADPDGLDPEIARLIELSSPITIHAGEAASAEKIWQAVYKQHARRIGHGVRLREQPKLLQFCINEGICMEMCPISNKFTLGFIAAGNEQDGQNRYNPHRIEHYPLRHFMNCGLEVCINTDNRSLHGSYGTLTDEYLWAAVLSGGFSRWEVLRLIKAGFKHAFIDKRDVHELIQAVEYWIFAHIANPPGLDWQPGAPVNGEIVGSPESERPS
jgi:adenosine deaminase